MNKPRQSDGRVVPENGPNKTGETEAEAQEGRRPAKRNVLQDPMSQTQSWTNDMPVVLERIRQAVRRNRKEKLTALYHHVYAVPRPPSHAAATGRRRAWTGRRGRRMDRGWKHD